MCKILFHTCSQCAEYCPIHGVNVKNIVSYMESMWRILFYTWSLCTKYCSTHVNKQQNIVPHMKSRHRILFNRAEYRSAYGFYKQSIIQHMKSLCRSLLPCKNTFLLLKKCQGLGRYLGTYHMVPTYCSNYVTHLFCYFGGNFAQSATNI